MKSDLEMIELLAQTTNKSRIAEHFGIQLASVDSWLHRIRERRRENRIYENRILSLEKRNPHLKKILLSAKPYEMDEEED